MTPRRIAIAELGAPLLDGSTSSAAPTPTPAAHDAAKTVALRCAIGCICGMSLIGCVEPTEAMLRTGVACNYTASGPRDSPGWSGSALCGDQRIVLKTTQQAIGDLNMLEMLAHLAGGPAVAVVADAIGRTQAIAISIVLQTVAKWFIFSAVALAALASPTSGGGDGAATIRMPMGLLIASKVFSGLCSITVPANAMIGDLTPAGSAGHAFTKLSLVQAAAAFLGHCAQLGVLRLYLSNYSAIALCLAILTPLPAIPLLLLRRPQKRLQQASQDGVAGPNPSAQDAAACGSSINAVGCDCSVDGGERRRGRGLGGLAADFVSHASAPLQLLTREPRLVQACAGTFLLCTGAMGGAGLMAPLTLTLGWRQGDLNLLQMITLVPSSLAALAFAHAVLFARAGAAFTLVLALLAFLSMALAFRAVPVLGTPAVALGLLSLGGATVGYPALLAVLTETAPSDDLAKAQACISFTATIAHAVAAPTFARLFDPTTIESAARPFDLACVLISAGLVILLPQLLPLVRDQWEAKAREAQAGGQGTGGASGA